jgi:hypothetical protein
MSIFLMRIFKLLLVKSFSSPNKVLSLLDRMLVHTTHKHGLSGTHLFTLIENFYSFTLLFSCLLWPFGALIVLGIICLTHGYWCIILGCYLDIWSSIKGENLYFFFLQNVQFYISWVLLLMVFHFSNLAFRALLMINKMR